jgi:hypothetical protein
MNLRKTKSLAEKQQEMQRSEDSSLLEKLVHDLIRKVDSHYEAMNQKIDSKVDCLQEKITDDLKDMKQDVRERNSFFRI